MNLTLEDAAIRLAEKQCFSPEQITIISSSVASLYGYIGSCFLIYIFLGLSTFLWD